MPSAAKRQGIHIVWRLVTLLVIYLIIACPITAHKALPTLYMISSSGY